MSTASETISLLSSARRQYAHTWSSYSLLFLPLVASTAATLTVSPQDGNEFILMRIGAYCTTNANPPVENATPQATFTMKVGSLPLFPDGSSQHLAPYSLSSADHRGHDLEFPVLVPTSTAISVTMTNLTAVDIMVRWMFWGMRLIPGGKGQNDL